MTTDTDKASDKLVEMALKAAFEKGWCAAAQWAQRDDLRHDTGSIAYAGQRDAILAGKAAEVRAAIIADLCGDVEPVARLLTWNGPAHTPVPHGGIAARTFTEFDKDTPAKDRYWFEGELLYPASTVAALKAGRDAALARVAELEKDAARLEFVCNSPNRMVERESGLWRVYEDVAPADHPTAVWQGMTPRWHVTPREAIDAAITAALTKGQP